MNLKQPKQLADPKMRDRKVRRKAFNKLKDVGKRAFMPIKSCGYGDGKKITCSICGKEVCKGTFKEGKWFCKEC